MNSVPTTADDVPAALQLLQGALGEEEARIRKEGSKAMSKGDYDTAQSVIDFAKRLLAFQKKVAGLEKEWGDLEDLRDKATPAVQEIVSKRFFGRSKRGDITSQDDYCAPILRVLIEMGGSGKTKDVIAQVGQPMKAVFKPQDYEKTATRTKELRWQNNARCEISDEGRAWLKTP